jgi:hypothetical protein
MNDPNPIMHMALDNDREIAAEIGILLSCYALIELQMFVVFSKLTSSTRDESEVILGNVSGFFSKMNILKKLLSTNTDPSIDKNRASEILNLVDKCNQIRNKYAHSVYSQVSVEGQVKWRTSSWLGDARRNNKFEIFELESIRKECEVLRQAIRDLYYFGHLELPSPEAINS